MMATENFTKAELVWALEIMFSIQNGTSEFNKMTIPALEKLYYGCLRNGMKTSDLAAKEKEQQTEVIELKTKIDGLERKIKMLNNKLKGARK